MGALLTVQKKLEKTSQKNGKKFWSLLLSDDVWYNTFDATLALRLDEGKTYDLVTETNGEFHNIKGIEAMVEMEASDPAAPPVVAAMVAPSKVEQAIATVVGERQHAIYCATLLAAAGKVPLTELGRTADKVLEYIRQLDKPTSVAPEHKSSSTEPVTDMNDLVPESFIAKE